MSTQTETLARTVWWCWILNEPMIMHWKDNKPHCPTCDMVDEHSLENGSVPSPDFRAEHSLICKVYKPAKR
jgi:hypothetical protein